MAGAAATIFEYKGGSSLLRNAASELPITRAASTALGYESPSFRAVAVT